LNVGFVGLGSIGLPMARRLLECGACLTVTNRTQSRADDLVAAGAWWVDSAAELTSAVDIVVSCLHGPDADRAVFLGEGGLLSVPAEGKLVINTSTIGPTLAVELAGVAAGRGADYLDVTLTGGGPPSAAAGTLVLPVGGDDEAVVRAMPVLSLLASVIEHVGPVGSSQVLKLAINSMFAASLVSLTQGARFAVRDGVDPAALGRLLPIGSGYSYLMGTMLPHMLSAPPARGTSLSVLAKDVRLAAEFGRSVGEAPTIAEAVAAAMAEALAGGLEGFANTALVDYPSPVIDKTAK
jgi:3-hydroxyisobutyrate dehydrogenase-like beta-hydroxyacid dehydrogenase